MNESDESLHFEVTLARAPLNADAAAPRIHLEAMKYLQAMRFLGDQGRQVPQEASRARRQHF